MRPTLARHGRRLLLASHARAPSCASYANPARRRPAPRPPAGRRTSERTFFQSLFKPPPRQVRQPEYEPGWMQIMVWRSNMLDQVRPPRRKELVDAWKRLMQSKLKRRIPLNSTQALQCRRLLDYLAEPSSRAGPTRPLDACDIAVVRRVLLELEPMERSRHHVDLAKTMHAVLSSGNCSGKAYDQEQLWSHLVQCLSHYGASLEALQMLYSRWHEPKYAQYLRNQDSLVEVVARGLAREGREKELVQLVNYALSHGVRYNRGIQAAIVIFFAQRDRVPETQRWLAKPIGRAHSLEEVYRAVASFAVRNDLRTWARQLFIELGQSRPNKRRWDVLLQAILIINKDVNGVGSLMSHMVCRSSDVKLLPPNIQTFNGLLEVAVETRDAGMAEEIMALSAAKGVAPNGETWLLLLELQLARGDLAGAQVAYDKVQYSEVWRNESQPALFEKYRQLLNRYMLLLCREAQPDPKAIRALLDAADEYQVLLDPETAALLCRTFLQLERPFDVIEVLSANAFLFSEAQREVVQDTFIDFCLDATTSTRRAWDAYQLMIQFFQDTNLERRTRLMEAFFDRKRSDMASHVFGHMRQHRSKDLHPKMDTYIRCLEGFARHPDREGLCMVHNMLKTDTTMQVTTKLYTAMMLAYTACDMAPTALEFWNDITQSRQGPSVASLEAVFWALERMSGGAKKAREVWDKIEKMDLEVPPAVYVAYVGAVAGSGIVDDVRSLIMNMASVVGSKPDAVALGVAHNALPGQKLQEEFREWAKEAFPDAWAELSKLGRRINEYQLCRFKIKRVMKA
ncbi:hypothetical protein CDD83_2656 [Cordyceps sp. RAO-2017]|nr:hypothetical protein CDD83_2656 [Cordyceps sp. RAO-2017]